MAASTILRSSSRVRPQDWGLHGAGPKTGRTAACGRSCAVAGFGSRMGCMHVHGPCRLWARHGGRISERCTTRRAAGALRFVQRSNVDESGKPDSALDQEQESGPTGSGPMHRYVQICGRIIKRNFRNTPPFICFSPSEPAEFQRFPRWKSGAWAHPSVRIRQPSSSRIVRSGVVWGLPVRPRPSRPESRRACRDRPPPRAGAG